VGVLLGSLTSLLFGAADFLGGEGAKRAPAAAIVLWSGVVSFPLVTIVALVNGGTAAPTDYGIGALAGASSAVGLVILFAGLGKGHAAAVAPSAGAVTATLPVLAAVLTGERPSALAWMGVAVAIPAIVLSAWVAEAGDVPFGGLWYGVFAGLGFGGWTVIMNQADESAELLPLITSRAATMVVVPTLAFLGIWRVVGWRDVPKGIVAANGLLEVSANATLLLALHVGSLALVGVSSSFNPVVTVALARLINREELRRRQLLGLALTLVALTAIALG
jgi:drug/metabolite transporter (DMT)-like permease